MFIEMFELPRVLLISDFGSTTSVLISTVFSDKGFGFFFDFYFFIF